jgi:hypothetical protein
MIAEIASGILCVAYLIVTALAQRPRFPWVRWLKGRDTFALIPIWTFFAPNPGTTDTRLLWRERLFDGTISPWHEVDPPTWGMLRAVWNPSKRIRKAITDASSILARRAAAEPKNKLLLISIPFLMILRYVCSFPASPLVVARQFVLCQTSGADGEGTEPKLVLVSNWHALVPVQEMHFKQKNGPTEAPTERLAHDTA